MKVYSDRILSKSSEKGLLDERTQNGTSSGSWMDHIPIFVSIGTLFIFLEGNSILLHRLLWGLTGLPLLFGVGVYTFEAIIRGLEPTTSSRRKFASLGLFIILIAYMGFSCVQNSTPYRISPEKIDISGPNWGMERWHIAPQIAYGYPYPVMRYFDDEIPDPDNSEILQTHYDIDHLLINLTLLSFPFYVIASIAFPFLPRHHKASSHFEMNYASTTSHRCD